MRNDVSRALRLLILPTLAVAVVVAVIPGRVGLVVRLYALFACAAALVVALAALRRAYPPETPLRGRGAAAPRPQQISTLARIEHEAAIGVTGSFDLHYRLVPRLRAIAGGLLASRRRISLDVQPELARDVVGEPTWALVRPDRPAPEDRLARGLPQAELARVVDALERI